MSQDDMAGAQGTGAREVWHQTFSASLEFKVRRPLHLDKTKTKLSSHPRPLNGERSETQAVVGSYDLPQIQTS